MKLKVKLLAFKINDNNLRFSIETETERGSENTNIPAGIKLSDCNNLLRNFLLKIVTRQVVFINLSSFNYNLNVNIIEQLRFQPASAFFTQRYICTQ